MELIGLVSTTITDATDEQFRIPLQRVEMRFNWARAKAPETIIISVALPPQGAVSVTDLRKQAVARARAVLALFEEDQIDQARATELRT
jgi:hypothetical protein